MEEPYVTCTLYTPQEFVGAMMDICVDKRGIFIDMQYEGGRVKLIYEIPLNEIIFEFFDQVKSRSRGYASFDYELKGYRESELVKLDILLNGELLSLIHISFTACWSIPRRSWRPISLNTESCSPAAARRCSGCARRLPTRSRCPAPVPRTRRPTW